MIKLVELHPNFIQIQGLKTIINEKLRSFVSQALFVDVKVVFTDIE